MGSTAARAEASDVGVTSLAFEQTVLDALGIAVQARSTATPYEPGQTGFAVAPESDLTFDAPGGDFEGFSGGALRHTGELILHFGGDAHVLSDFELRVATDPLHLELFDRAGRRWLLFEDSQPLAGDEGLVVRNVDINLAPEMAAQLGRPELAGSFLGRADLDLPAPPGGSPAARTSSFAVGPCDDVFTSDRDISLLDLGRVSQLAREAGGRIALTFAARLANTGTSAILWKFAIEPDGPPADVGEHPFLALHVYRILNGKITQIGRSDAKHAFFTTNFVCSCVGGHTIYPGCEDVYGSSTNSDRTYFAPRQGVSVGTGSWTRLGSHFDATPVDDFRDHGGDVVHDDYEHRLLVAESELLTGGSYFVEAWYIISGDVNLWNSLGHEAIAPSFAAGTWSFTTLSALVPGSILDEYVDPVTPPAGSANAVLDTGEGRLQLAVSTTDAGGGLTHYEYALMNFDFDRQIRSFSVPIEVGLSISGEDFGDADVVAGNDWSSAVGGSSVTWTAPAGNELDWGTLYRFGFDADATPVATSVALGVLEPGAPAALSFGTLGPTPVVAVPAQGPFLRWLWLAGIVLGGSALAAHTRRRGV